MRTRVLAALALAAAAYAQSADRNKVPGPINDGFYGPWRMEGSNRIKAASVLNFVERAGAIETDSSGRTYSFKFDGRDYPTGAPDQTISWRKNGNHGYEATQKDKGEVTTVTTFSVSEDGNTLQITATPRNGPAAEPVLMSRSAGGGTEPLLGFWQIVRTPGAKILEAVPNGLRVTSSIGDNYTANFDGREYPLTGTAMPPNTTVSVRRVDDRTFEETRKTDGAVIGRIRYELSDDGRSMTQTVTDLRSESPATTVTKWAKE
jgi:hypothetical protein